MPRLKAIAAHCIYLQAVFLVLLPSFAQAATLTSSLQAAADHFASYLQSSDSIRKIRLISVINLTSKIEDKTGGRIRKSLGKELQKRNIELVFDEPAEGTETAYLLSGAYIKAGSRIMLKLSLSEGRTVYSEFEAEWPAEKTVSKSQRVVLNIVGNVIPDESKQALSNRYRAQLCQHLLEKESEQGLKPSECVSRINDSADVREIVSTHIFNVGKDSYLIFSKAMDRKSETLLRSKTVEHHGNIDSIGEALDRLADLMSGHRQEPPVERKSFVSRSKWHLTALSITAVSLWMVYNETSKYYDLSEENSGVRTQYLLATAQADITRLKSAYNDNAGKMDQHEESINRMTLIAALAICWEAYLLYSSFQEETPHQQAGNTGSSWKQRIHIAPVQTRHSSGLKLAISWKF